jgi:hypothetical protein
MRVSGECSRGPAGGEDAIGGPFIPVGGAQALAAALQEPIRLSAALRW